MVANADKTSDQSLGEALKIVPHFFGAAIVGENPRVFGVDLGPLSSYTSYADPRGIAAPSALTASVRTLSKAPPYRQLPRPGEERS